MLTRYVREQGWKIAGEYIDDGYSGINFDRPSFKRMITDIEAGKINCVITKDLSRLGRNYLETGAYIEIFFPEHSVRYIALTDGVDTVASSSTLDITPFRNLLNDMYSKDLSKKVKTAKKARLLQGKFAASSAPYGYMKDPNDKNHLVIDEKIAPVVRRIFDLAKRGWGISRIRQLLTDEHTARPAASSSERGGNFERFFEDDANRYIWSNNSVRGILRNPVYAGHLAGYKRPIPSMKSKKRLSALPEDYLIVKDTHEPIIPPDDFELVQKLITSRRKSVAGVSGYDNIFSGIIKCGDCGYAMRTCPAHRIKRPNPIDNMLYFCNQYGIYGKKMCTSHKIEARELHRVVLEDIQRHAEMALQDDKKLLKRIVSKVDQNAQIELSVLKKELRQAEKRLAELDRLFSKLYEDNICQGKMSNFSKEFSLPSFKSLVTKKESELLTLKRNLFHH